MKNPFQIRMAGVAPADAQSGAVFVHGRGSSAESILGLVPELPFDSVSFLAPHAPGGAWYPHRFLAQLAENQPDLDLALDALEAAVQQLLDAGLPQSRIVLAGFSQGACLAAEYAARKGGRFGQVAILSGALMGPLERHPRYAPDLSETPVLLACAEKDLHIPLEYVLDSSQRFKAMNARVEELIFPGSLHGLIPEELEWMRQNWPVF